MVAPNLGAPRIDEVTILSTVMSWTSRPPPTLAALIRALLIGSCERLLEPDDVQCVAMAGYEMTDNVIKYSLGGEGQFEAEVVRRQGAIHARLCSINPAAPEHRQAARHLVALLQSAPNAGSVYDSLIASSPARLGSGLGLARIQVEAEMSLHCAADEARITFVASRQVAARGLP